MYAQFHHCLSRLLMHSVISNIFFSLGVKALDRLEKSAVRNHYKNMPIRKHI